MGEVTDIAAKADVSSLPTLLSWLSPAFPIGGFAYSAGLETMVAERSPSETEFADWIASQIECGTVWNDAVLLAAAYRSDETADETVDAVAVIALALAGSAERLRETLDQGTAFRDACAPWFDAGTCWPDPAPLPCMVGLAGRRRAIPLGPVLTAFIHAFASAQCQAAIRLGVIGQTGAARVLAAMSDTISEAAARAATSTLDDLGQSTIGAEIAMLRHETLSTRLFLS